MGPAGQAWSTVEDLATYASFLVNGHVDVLAGATLAEMTIPQSGSLAGGMSGGHGLGFRLAAGGSGTVAGHTGSMPGFLAGLLVDRTRRTAAVCLANGTQGLRAEGLPLDLLGTLEELEPTIADVWSPNDDVPDAVAEILGVWHWGNTAYAFSYRAGQVVATPLGTALPSYTFSPQTRDSFLGTSGYHHGETLRVVRDDDGAVNHLSCATFIYTRAPYDPAAPIPGGPPVR